MTSGARKTGEGGWDGAAGPGPQEFEVVRTDAAGFEGWFARLCARGDADDQARVARDVAEIVARVRAEGDAALVEYTARFDRRPDLTEDALEVSQDDLHAALAGLQPDLREALTRAAGRIRAFHAVQQSHLHTARLEDGRGLSARLLVRPLARVGLYVPGGTAAYPSTVLMNAVPAKVAGVPEVVMVSPSPGGAPNPVVLAAAALAGVDRVFTIGGAQAVAALAYGTARVPRVDKIVGPGNAWVAEAKRQVYGAVDIDSVAGPSEVLIVADEGARPEVVAADLLAQAEHDVRAAAVLVTWHAPLAEAVATALAEQVATLPRKEACIQALTDRGGLIVCRDEAEAYDLANRYASEHLGLAVRDPEAGLLKIENAGAVFLGHHTPEALGDYNAGVNHVLPTSGTARFASPLSVHDFIKRTSVLSVSQASLQRLGPEAARLARAEGLEAHARAIEIRGGQS